MSTQESARLTTAVATYVPDALMRAIFGQYRLSWMGVHGLAHWARVLDNGLRVAEGSGADEHVVTLFAVFHDACRRNDNHDPEHGPRAAQLFSDLRHLAPEVSERQASLLVEACREHTNGAVHADPTIGACWDADRLDLARVGIHPNARYLSTEVARAPAMIVDATGRAVRDHVYDVVTDVWLPIAQDPDATS